MGEARFGFFFSVRDAHGDVTRPLLTFLADNLTPNIKKDFGIGDFLEVPFHTMEKVLLRAVPWAPGILLDFCC